MNVIAHIPCALAKVVHEFMSEWKVIQVLTKPDRKYRGALEGTCVPSCKIEKIK